MQGTNYVHSVVRTRLLEKELLTQVKFEQLIEAEDVASLWRMLETTSYANLLQHFAYEESEFEQFLTDALQLAYKEVRSFLDETGYIELLQLKYDYYNAKVLIKGKFLEENLHSLFLPLGRLTTEELKTYLENLPFKPNKTRLDQAIEKTLADFEQYQDPQRIDLLLDRYYIEHLYDELTLLNLPLFETYLRTKIDFVNLQTLLRVQKQERDLAFLREVLLPYGYIEEEKFIFSLQASPAQIIRNIEKETIGKYAKHALEIYGETGSIQTLEREMDHYLLALLDDAKYIHFGPEPLMAYLLKKEAEVKNLRIVFVSKLNNVPVKRIAQRVRDVYV